MPLSDLIFSDLFVAENATVSWYKATPDSMNTQPTPVECEQELAELRQQLDAQSGSSDFRVDWPNTSGLRLRIKRMLIAESKTIYVCRRFRLQPGTLNSLV